MCVFVSKHFCDRQFWWHKLDFLICWFLDEIQSIRNEKNHRIPKNFIAINGFYGFDQITDISQSTFQKMFVWPWFTIFWRRRRRYRRMLFMWVYIEPKKKKYTPIKPKWSKKISSKSKFNIYPMHSAMQCKSNKTSKQSHAYECIASSKNSFILLSLPSPLENWFHLHFSAVGFLLPLWARSIGWRAAG